MARGGFLEEVAFEDGEEPGCAFQGLEWPVRMHQAVKPQGPPGNDVYRNGEFYNKEPPLASVLLRDIPNQHFFFWRMQCSGTGAGLEGALCSHEPTFWGSELKCWAPSVPSRAPDVPSLPVLEG